MKHEESEPGPPEQRVRRALFRIINSTGSLQGQLWGRGALGSMVCRNHLVATTARWTWRALEGSVGLGSKI